MSGLKRRGRVPEFCRVLAFGTMALLAVPVLAVTVRLDAKDASSTVLLHVGDRLRVELPTAPATGFRWKAKLLDASHLEALSKEVRPESGRLDAAGVQVFVWKAISPGQAQIAIAYARPNPLPDVERKAVPSKQLTVSVEIAGDALGPADVGQDRAATYAGTLPCEGCTGIDVELALFGALEGTNGGGFFVERRRYLGSPGGDRTIAGTGTLAIVHGTYADPSMTIYVLTGADGGQENLKVEGDRLVPLDAQMLPIPLPPGAGFGLVKTPSPP